MGKKCPNIVMLGLLLVEISYGFCSCTLNIISNFRIQNNKKITYRVMQKQKKNR